MVSTILALGTSDVAEMVCSLDPWAVTLPDGALTTKVEAGRAIINAFKKVGLSLVVLPSEALHTLQAGVITELQAREQRVLGVISEQKVNNVQLFVEKTSAIDTWKKVRRRMSTLWQ